jgi:fumarate hydratase class II
MVNPTQCEAMSMVCVQVIGNDTTIGFAGSQGNFQLNVYKPLLIHNLLHSIRILSDACRDFCRFLIVGLKPNEENLRKNSERSLMNVTALSPVIGYDKAARIAHKAEKEGTTLREACVALGFLSEEEFDTIVQPMQMAYPHGQ